MLSVDKFPVVIVANYRTGSSALISHITEKYDLFRFDEPHNDEVHIKKLNEIISDGVIGYTVKFIADQIAVIDTYKQLLLMPGYKIKLTRNNKINQIASYYIAMMTNRWRAYSYNPNFVDYEVPISDEWISFCIEKITNVDSILESLDVDFDETLTYEELGYIENKAEFALTVQPRNFDEIKAEIEKRYQS